jgi:small subunit ribosomal protein S6
MVGQDLIFISPGGFMIYELSVVTKPELGAEAHAQIAEIVKDALKGFEGELLIADDWGKLHLAQPYKSGSKHGHFHYFMYKSNTSANTELVRRFGINEGVLRSAIFVLGDDSAKDELVKNFKTPLSKTYRGSVLDNKNEDEDEGGFEDMEDDRRKFAKRKSCWFTAKKIKADWKDPQTWNWLVSEFGKISPARVSGISKKHQRFANTAIKQARNLGISSYLSNRTADRA